MDKIVYCQTMTMALKAKSVLNNNKIKVYIKKSAKKDCGCGHALYIDAYDFYRAINILDNSKINYSL